MEMCDGTPGQLHVNGHSFANNYNVKTSITRDWALGIGYRGLELDCSLGLPAIVALNQRI